VQAAHFKALQTFTPRALIDLHAYLDRQEEHPTRLTHSSPARVVIIGDVIDEIPQLATRLMLTSPALFERYDRLTAEAAFRINFAPPLFILMVMLGSRSPLPLVGLILALVISGTLLRQGSRRAIAARDIIVQAIVIPDVKLQSAAITEPRRDLAQFESVAARVTENQRQRLRTLLRIIWNATSGGREATVAIASLLTAVLGVFSVLSMDDLSAALNLLVTSASAGSGVALGVVCAGVIALIVTVYLLRRKRRR
jgi:hypothetical protein